MPKDGLGNEYTELCGRSRVVNEEQRLAMMRRPHELRGCCPMPPHCCKTQVPRLDFSREDGARWTCPTCGTEYVWDTDEASGSAWFPVERPATMQA